jgi:hypothetical protein
VTANLCPACEVGETYAAHYAGSYFIAGEYRIVEGLQGMLCTECHNMSQDPEQIKHNEYVLRSVRKALEFGA